MGDYVDPGDVLLKAIREVQVAEGQESALIELAYTASERGIIPFEIRDDCARLLIQLVEISYKYRNCVPTEVRM